ncbi:MAG: DUF488 domain-containing protein [Alphaproteobacteria bacterium]|nr:DUF488 domain-containing protein [Alphaproteobacteria bacterium]
MYYRQKILLALLQSFGGKLSNIDLQKYLFLFTQICQKDKSYEFVPYRFGCFSFQSYVDRRRLTEFGYLNSKDSWELDDDTDHIATLKNGEAEKLSLFTKKYNSIRGNDLVRAVYKQFPYYAIRSEIANDLLNDDELTRVRAATPAQTEPCLFTIGYEGTSFENYLNRLLRNNVSLLCDVRKNPISRKYGFSQKVLSETLEKLGIKYIHIPDLGIVSDKRKTLKSQSDYNKLFNEYDKTTLMENGAALSDVYKLLIDYNRIAITCFEAEVCMCHRGQIAKALEKLPEWKFEIQHI